VDSGLHRIHQRFVILVDFAGVVLLWAASILLFSGGTFMIFWTIDHAKEAQVRVALTAVILWVVAFWLARRGRDEFCRAMAGGPETAKTLTEKSVLELLSCGVAFGDSSLREEFQQMQGKPARDVHAWINGKLAEHPEDVGLLFVAAQTYLDLGIASGAEETLRKIRAGALSANAGWLVDLMLTRSLYLQDRWDEAERLCEQCIDSDVSARRKSMFIDQFVCEPLFAGDERHFARMEKWARKALEIDPRNISLQGTLGGIMAEQGRVEEAAPFLKKCLRSREPHDRGISTFYLGVIERRAGNLVEAKRLYEQALSIWSGPWFVLRIQRELAALQIATK
jgi:tetratricopeptide (TPR) repeat protein